MSVNQLKRGHRLLEGRRPIQGMSLVELLGGVAIGLFIVAAATLMVGNQLTDNRRLLLETQLQQDMRASMDIMTRQIRRAGAWENNASLTLLATDGGAEGSYFPEQKDIQIGAAGDEISFNYWLNKQDRIGWGFRLRNGVIQTNLARAGWQDLTDRSTVKINSLLFTPITSTSEAVVCPKLCPDGTTNCWPSSVVRTFQITLQAEAASDPLVKRQMQAVARVRNELPGFQFPVVPASAQPQLQPCPP